jgi:hypothetical protein
LLPGIILAIAQYKANKCDCQKNPGEQGGDQDGLFVAEYRYQSGGHKRCNEEQKRLDDMPRSKQLHGDSHQSGSQIDQGHPWYDQQHRCKNHFLHWVLHHVIHLAFTIRAMRV